MARNIFIASFYKTTTLKLLVQFFLPMMMLLVGCSKSKEDSPFQASAEGIVIGTQHWMKENLNEATYRNGDIIPQVTDPAAWYKLTTGAWCYYNNDSLNGAIYGKLYNWYAVNDPRGLAPKGWHIPTDAEWTNLSDKLGGIALAGGKMKIPGTSRWTTPNSGATNESGFSGLPGGSCNYDGSFSVVVGKYGLWWSASEGVATSAWARSLSYDGGSLGRGGPDRRLGCSVRCLRD